MANKKETTQEQVDRIRMMLASDRDALRILLQKK